MDDPAAPADLPDVPAADRGDEGEHMRAKLFAALAAAQAEFPPIPKDRTVKVTTKTGGTYTFAYATLDAILHATRPVLNKHGLAIVQLLQQTGGRPEIATALLHKDGGELGSSFPLLNVPNTPQELGSLLTYLRRYAITALLGIAAEEDDDARQAADAPAKPKPKPKPAPTSSELHQTKVGAREQPAAPNTPQTAPEQAKYEETASPAQLAEISRLIMRLANVEQDVGDHRTNWNEWAAEYASVQTAGDLNLRGAARLIGALEREEARLVGELARQMAERDA